MVGKDGELLSKRHDVDCNCPGCTEWFGVAHSNGRCNACQNPIDAHEFTWPYAGCPPTVVPPATL